MSHEIIAGRAGRLHAALVGAGGVQLEYRIDGEALALWSAARAWVAELLGADRAAQLDQLVDALVRDGIGLAIAAPAAGSAEVVLDVSARHAWRAQGIAEEVLARLGLDAAWPDVAGRVQRRGFQLDELRELAIGRAGVRVSALHRDVSFDELGAVLDGSPVAGVVAALGRSPHVATWHAYAAGAPPRRGVALAIGPAALDAGAHANHAHGSAAGIVERYEHDVLLADHPYLRRVAREPVHLGHLWLIVANFWEGIVASFPSRLARVIANIEDDRVRSILVKQLNDELGEGDFARAHKAMFRTFADAVEPFRLAGRDEELLAPGRAFGEALEAVMFSPDANVAVGAMMMVEIYGKQVDLFMGSQFRRQTQLDLRALHWLHLHEDLEVEHAGDALTLAACVPDEPVANAAAWRGADAVVEASRQYFDALYRLGFGSR